MIKRRKTRQITVGRVKIGGNAPVSIQSMTNTETSDVRATVAQIKRLEHAGCEIIRVAVKDLGDAAAVRAIKRNIRIPLVCDIHFNHLLALECIKGGADKIRLNPGNIRNKEEIAAVVKAASCAKVPIRVGVNSGSFRGDMVKGAIGYIKLFEELGFRDIIISLKASDAVSTVDAYRRMSKLCDYPLHLGVTAAGPHDAGVIKSSIGIGSLLLDGIGDTVRVSLTGDPADEISSAKKILSSLNIRRFGPEIISCPTCGRCQVNLIKLVEELDKRVKGPPPIRKPGAGQAGSRVQKKITIAMMGCEVNGPGEAREADIGIAFGKNSGVLFRHGKILKKVAAKDAVKELLRLYEME
jgi:(E)-4-hydroxy-3-methylbut-2-enyl-diphosphate synthase